MALHYKRWWWCGGAGWQGLELPPSSAEPSAKFRVEDYWEGHITEPSHALRTNQRCLQTPLLYLVFPFMRLLLGYVVMKGIGVILHFISTLQLDATVAVRGNDEAFERVKYMPEILKVHRLF